MTGSTSSVCGVFLLMLAVGLKTSCGKYIHGREAEKLCQAYKKVCPRGKVCAVQIIDISTKTIKFPVCVHQFQLKVRSPVCKQAPSPGRCGAQFRRWYFNVHMAACSWFTYSGCGGNDNNFRSREECERICVVGKEDDDDVAFDAMSTRQTVPEKLRHLDPRHPDSQTPDASEPSKGQDTTSGNMDLGHGVSENAPHYRSDETVPSESLYEHNVKNSNSDSDVGPMNLQAQPAHTKSQVEQSVVNSYDESPFDIYGVPYILTPASSTTAQSVSEQGTIGRSDDNNYRWAEMSTFRQPLQTPDNHPRILRKPLPRYHHHSNHGNHPAALHTEQPNQRAFYNLPMKMPHLAAAERTRKLTDFPDRRLTNFSDKTRRLTDNANLEGIAEQMMKTPVASTPRRGPRPRTPHRVLSLLSRGPLLANTPPRPASHPADVRAGLTSSLRSSYAPDANEAIRRFPSRRHYRKAHRGVNRKRYRRRRRRNRKRSRRYRTRRGRKNNSVLQHSWGQGRGEHQARVMADSNSTSSNTSSAEGALHKDLPQTHLAEFRLKDTIHIWPPQKTQSIAQARGKMTEEEAKKPEEEKKKRRRRLRKRRRRLRGRRRGDRVLVEEGSKVNVSSVLGGHRYYESFHLFSVLGHTNNDTDVLA